MSRNEKELSFSAPDVNFRHFMLFVHRIYKKLEVFFGWKKNKNRYIVIYRWYLFF